MSIRKNAAGQGFGFTLVKTTDGTILTGATVTVVRCIDGTFAAATGTVTESSGHYWFAMSQADTNGDDISFLFTATGAVPVEKTIVTTKSTAVGYEAIDWGAVNAPTGAQPNVNVSYVNSIQVKGAGTAVNPWNPV